MINPARPVLAASGVSRKQMAGIVAICAGIGPLVGLLTIACTMAVRAAWAGQGVDTHYIVAFFLIYGLPFAYGLGMPVGTLFGIVLALVARWQGRIAGWMALALGVSSWLAWTLWSQGLKLWQPMPGEDVMWDMLAVHVVSALACWRLAVAWAGLHR